MADDFKPMDYPRIVLPSLDAPLAPPSGRTDVFDMPARKRIIWDVDGRASGGFTRTGNYLTLHRSPPRERALYPGGIDDLPY